MITLLALAISICIGAGVWLLLSRDLFRMMMGLAVLAAAVNLVVFLAGNPTSLTPPVIIEGAEQLTIDAANPLTQALVLTAIVIGFALLSFGLVLAARLSTESAHCDVNGYLASEPQTESEQRSNRQQDRPPVLPHSKHNCH